jgi:hypothetical protein
VTGGRLRSLAAALVLALGARAAGAQEPQYFEEAPARPKFSLRWDFLGRYDRVDHSPVYETISRGRFQLRPEVDFDPWDDLRIGVRGTFDYGTDKYSYPETDNYKSREAAFDRYYVLWRPGGFQVLGGKFGMPLVSTQMLWDRDIQTLGAAASWTSAGGTWTLAGAGFYGPQRDGDESIIGAGQVIWSAGDENRFAIQAAAAYWGFDMRDMPDVYIRENTSQVVDGTLSYASRFHVANLLLRLQFPLLGQPVLISLDGIQNFAARERQNLAFEGVVAMGQVGTPWDWRASFSYQYIQRNALVGAYNSDDWWWHTWYEGYRLAVAITFLPRVYVQGAVVIQRRLDQDYWLNRYLIDLVKMF